MHIADKYCLLSSGTAVKFTAAVIAGSKYFGADGSTAIWLALCHSLVRLDSLCSFSARACKGRKWLTKVFLLTIFH